MLPLPDANFRAKTQKGARTARYNLRHPGIGQKTQMTNFSEEKINY
jgi:hypothetical protein